LAAAIASADADMRRILHQAIPSGDAGSEGILHTALCYKKNGQK